MAEQQFLDSDGLRELLKSPAVQKDLRLRQKNMDVSFNDSYEFPTETADAVSKLATAYYNSLQ